MPSSFSSFTTGDPILASHVSEMHAPIQDLQRGKAFYGGSTGGSPTAYAVSLTPAPDTTLLTGMTVSFLVQVTNTAGSPNVMLSVNGMTAKPILKAAGDSLVAGDLKAGQMATVIFDASGDSFKLIGSTVQDLDDLTDVDISSPSSGQVLRHNGTKFVNASLAAGDLPISLDAAKIGNGTVSNTEFEYLNGVTSSIQNQLKAKIPIGAVIPFPGATAPSGWLLCAGQYVSSSTYGELYTVLGGASSPYGVSGGNFAVPDLRGRVVAGKDNMGGSAAGVLTNSGTGNPGIDGSQLNASGGADRYSLTAAELPQHTHSITTRLGGSGYPSQPAAAVGAEYGNVVTGSAGLGNAHPNCQPTRILNYIIFSGV